jgi:hypothetical protein
MEQPIPAPSFDQRSLLERYQELIGARATKRLLLARLFEEWIDLIGELSLARQVPLSAQEPSPVAWSLADERSTHL